MRKPVYDTSAPKQTVSVTLNSDLYARAKAFDINASRVAEEALAYAVEERLNEQLRREVAQDIAAMGSFMDAHREQLEAMDRELEQLRAEADSGAQAVTRAPSATPHARTRAARPRRPR